MPRVDELVKKLEPLQSTCWIIFDDYQGLHLEKSNTEYVIQKLKDLGSEYVDCFYLRAFCQEFDAVWFYGDVYFSSTKSRDTARFHLVDELRSDYKDPRIVCIDEDSMPGGIRYISVEEAQYE